MLRQNPETHEEAVDMVKTIFEQMGGTVLPPRRPGRKDKYELLTPERDAFMMDFENACLSQEWDNSKKQFPTGRLRHADAEWGAMIKTQVYPHSSEIDWEEYCEWVFHGGGNEYFREEEDEPESIEEDEPEVKMEKRQVMRDTRCSGCGRGDDFCRCGSFDCDDGPNSLWWGN
jgi:hypothetical protein